MTNFSPTQPEAPEDQRMPLMSIPITTAAVKNFVGAWELESYTEYSGAEEPVQPFGSNPVGFLIYTEDGIVSAQLMKPNRKQLAAGAWQFKDPEALAELAEGYIAYHGRYFIDEPLGQMIHLPVLALVPNLIDQCQYRLLTFDDAKLTLRTFRTESDGRTVETRLTWYRSKRSGNLA
jgi:Lipocalin-like domain